MHAMQCTAQGERHTSCVKSVVALTPVHVRHPLYCGERPMERFQPGDVVRLKSGGPWMIITALGAYSGWTMWGAATVACRWFEGEKQQETVFDVALLEKVSSRDGLHRDRLRQRVNLLHDTKKSEIFS